ncbi:MAG: K+/H+ antiporter subunit F, partial [Burkholderiaceae bacterium]|nr:K+/H+ antiporter subunit F [Burkholderiaceae bacterium]
MSPLLRIAIDITLVCYGIAMLLALWRALRGPSAQDRVLAVDFVSIVGMLLMLVIGIRSASS